MSSQPEGNDVTGAARPRGGADTTVPDDAASGRASHSEYGVAVLLLALGAFAIYDAQGLVDPGSRGFVNSRTLPTAVGILLVVTAVLLAVDVFRGGHGEAEGGEDVDLESGTDWRTMGLLIASFVANALLIDRLGWPISGAILFFGSAYALGARHLVRTALIAVVMSVGTWYLFNLVLGIKLPVGVLKGIL